MDKFWTVTTPPLGDECLHYIRVENAGNAPPLWLKKVIDFYETDFISVHKAWVFFLEGSLDSNAEARECDARLNDMIRQFQVAVERYGYFSEISVD